MNLLEKISADIAERHARKIDLALFSNLNKVRPPIEGIITKGKLRWRGIKIVIDRVSGKTYLYQRGENLGVIFNDELEQIKIS